MAIDLVIHQPQDHQTSSELTRLAQSFRDPTRALCITCSLIAVVMTGQGPRFITPFLSEASTTRDEDLPRTSEDDLRGDLEQHARQIKRMKNLDQCENSTLR